MPLQEKKVGKKKSVLPKPKKDGNPIAKIWKESVVGIKAKKLNW